MIKFHPLLGKSPVKIHQVIQQAVQDFCPSHETARRWIVAIREGKEELDDEALAGWPVTATSAIQVLRRLLLLYIKTEAWPFDRSQRWWQCPTILSTRS